MHDRRRAHDVTDPTVYLRPSEHEEVVFLCVPSLWIVYSVDYSYSTYIISIVHLEHTTHISLYVGTPSNAWRFVTAYSKWIRRSLIGPRSYKKLFRTAVVFHGTVTISSGHIKNALL